MPKGYKVETVQVILSQPIDVSEQSKTGLYAVCKAKSLWPLRITMFKELAELWRNDSTVVYDCTLQKV